MTEEIAYDVLVAGAGAGGICAAVAAARTGAKTLLVEKAPEVGGTGIHSPVALVCTFHARDHRPINLGIHQELFPEMYAQSTLDKRPSAKRMTYDEAKLLERYKALIEGTAGLTLIKGRGVASVARAGRRLERVTLDDGSSHKARVFVDGTAEAFLSQMAGMRTMRGREKDGSMQSATLTFSVSGFDPSLLKDPDISTRAGMESLLSELDALYKAQWQTGMLMNPKSHIMAFPYPDCQRILFNSNEVVNVDPTDADSVAEARVKGEGMVMELFDIIRQHPAFSSASICAISPKMGVREGPRVVGDYLLTAEDCLGEARFEDMVAASAYMIDIHDPDGGETTMQRIPGSGYYHIPYRSLIAADAENLLIGSRCISGTHEAFSSYRVISGVTAIGQAAGTAAALAAQQADGRVRDISAPLIRSHLRREAQFVEGSLAFEPE